MISGVFFCFSPFFFFFLQHHMAYRILGPRSGIEPVPLHWKHGDNARDGLSLAFSKLLYSHQQKSLKSWDSENTLWLLLLCLFSRFSIFEQGY